MLEPSMDLVYGLSRHQSPCSSQVGSNLVSGTQLNISHDEFEIKETKRWLRTGIWVIKEVYVHVQFRPDLRLVQHIISDKTAGSGGGESKIKVTG